MVLWSYLATTWWSYWGLLWRSLANYLGWLEGYRRAVRCLSRAIRHAPQDASLYFWRGTLYWRELGHPERAEADLSRAIELRPDLARAYLNRGLNRQYAPSPDLPGAMTDLVAFLARSDDPYWRDVAQRHLQQLEQAQQQGAD